MSDTFRELLLELVQDAIAGQHLDRAGIRLAALADRGEELAILQLDGFALFRDAR